MDCQSVTQRQRIVEVAAELASCFPTGRSRPTDGPPRSSASQSGSRDLTRRQTFWWLDHVRRTSHAASTAASTSPSPHVSEWPSRISASGAVAIADGRTSELLSTPQMLTNYPSI